ncbi:unnamed protein product [Heterobilharzia americana]|nr:unnamed protein product [Heterobilharzia americana]
MAPSRFNENHLSVLSLSDYDGEVVCSSNWLYWGESTVGIDGNVSHLRIIEQCDFVDDHLFQPLFKSRPYAERCLDCEISLHSRKLSYICKEQLGHESAFPQVYLDPTTLFIDVFVFAYDISLSGSSALQQAAFLRHFISRLSSLKLPVVFATTKHDLGVSNQASTLFNEALGGIKRRWIKNVCIVETSSRLNINVSTVFQCAAFFGHHRDAIKHKLPTGFIPSPFKRPNNDRKSFSVCFKKSLWSSLRWFRYDTNASDANPDSVNGELPNYQHEAGPPQSVHPRAFHSPSNELKISEQCISNQAPISFNQKSGVTDLDTPIKNIGSPLQLETCQPITSLFSDAYSPRHSLSIQDATLAKTNNTCDLSVLPPPPSPLLLPNPYAVSSLETMASSEEVQKSAVVPFNCTDLSCCKILENPCVTVYVHGQSETCSQVTTVFQDFCSLKHYTTKNGQRFRVIVLSNLSRSPVQTPIPPNLSPFYSDPPNCRSTCISTQPVCIPLTASQISAFSAPSGSLLGSSFGAITVDNHNNKKELSLVTNVVQDKMVSRDYNADKPNSSQSLHSRRLSQCNRLSEFCINLFVYKSANELSRCYELIKDDAPNSTYRSSHDGSKTNQKSIKVLAYLYPSNSGILEKRNTILSGLLFSSRYRIPYFVVNSDSYRSLLDSLLHLATDVQPKESLTAYTSELKNSFVDWRFLMNVDYFSIISEWIGLSDLTKNGEFIESEFRFVGLLAAVIMSDCNRMNNYTRSYLHNTKHGLFFSPPSVTTTTAICWDPQSHYRLTNDYFPPISSHFMQLDQVAGSLSFQASNSSMAYIPHVLVIHYVSSYWSEVGMHIESSLKSLWSLLDSYHLSGRNFPLILLVAFYSGSSQKIPIEAEGIFHGLKLIQHLAQTYGCPLFLPSSEYDPVKAGFTTCSSEQTSSVVSAVQENGPTNVSFCSVDCNNIPSAEVGMKPSLGFLSVSRSDDVRAVLYNRVFEGNFHGWFPTSVISDESLNDPVSSKTVANTENDFLNMQTSECASSKILSVQPHLPSDFQVMNSAHPSIPYSSEYGVVTLPWLPLNPADAFHIQSPRTPENFLPASVSSNLIVCKESDNHRHLSRKNRLSSMERCDSQPISCDFCQSHPKCIQFPLPEEFSSVCAQSYSAAIPLSGMNSSVEEYYTELPKIGQSDALGMESYRPHPNRPKRPHPRIYSYSSSPSSVSHEQGVLSSDMMFDQTKTGFCNSLFQNTSPHTSDHLIADNVSTVYAEVNDAFVYNTLPYHCSSLVPSSKVIFVPSKTISNIDHYEIADYSLQKLTKLTLNSSYPHHVHTFKSCDDMHRNSLTVPLDSNENGCSNSSYIHQLSNKFSCDKFSNDIISSRSNSQFNPKLKNLPALPSIEISPSTLPSCSSSLSSIPFFGGLVT